MPIFNYAYSGCACTKIYRIQGNDQKSDKEKSTPQEEAAVFI